MSNVGPKEHGQNTPARGERLAASTLIRFYAFAEQCPDWAKITRSIQERIGYGQIALKYLAAVARLQTILLQAGRATRPIEQTEYGNDRNADVALSNQG
jgi:hypothetical protein